MYRAQELQKSAVQNKGSVLLTGASGFIGSHLAASLLQEGYTLYAPVRAESVDKIAALRNHENFHLLTGAFYDPALLQTVTAPLDFILHLAAIRGGGRADKASYQRVNVQGTQTLIDFARSRGAGGFLYLSTVGVLGTIPEESPASENSPIRPDGFYHISKWQGEQLLRRNAGALPYIILRPTITYGTGDDGFIYKMRQLVRSGKMVLPGAPVRIHLLSVNALCRLITTLLQNNRFNGNSYLIADREPVQLQSVTALMARSGGKYITVPKAIFRAADILLAVLRRPALRTSVQLISRHWTYDISSAVADLQFEPPDTLTELQRLMEDYDAKNI